MTARRVWDQDIEFGVCPSTDTSSGRCCNDGYINVAGRAWFFCGGHKVAWPTYYKCEGWTDRIEKVWARDKEGVRKAENEARALGMVVDETMDDDEREEREREILKFIFSRVKPRLIPRKPGTGARLLQRHTQIKQEAAE